MVKPIVVHFFMELSEAEMVSKALSHVVDQGLEEDLDLCLSTLNIIDEAIKDAS